MLHKNIIKLAALLWCVLTVASCTNEDFDKGNNGLDVPEGLPVTLKLNIGTPEVPVVETKSLDNGDTFGAINDLAVLVYDEKGENPIVTFHDVEGENQTSVNNMTFDAKTGKHKIYVLANVGSEDAAKEYTTEQALLSKQIESQEPMGTEMMLGFVAKDMETSINLYNSGNNEVIDITGDASFAAKVVPPYSKITFKITKDLPSDKHVYLAITEVNVRHLPVKYSLLPYEKWTMDNGVSGESIISLYENKSAKPEDEVGALVAGKDFYMYENLQGENNISNDDPSLKTPVGLEVPTIGDGKIDYTEWFKKWSSVPCTYIEVKGNYTIFTSEPGVNHVGDGEINYRFFLGENSTSDFNIKRNTHYNVTLAFTGLAGKDELQYEWRVQADLNNSTFYPKGALMIDGSKEDFPFWIVNTNIDKLSITTSGYTGSDMQLVYWYDYLGQEYRVATTIFTKDVPLPEKGEYQKYAVVSNNLGVIGTGTNTGGQNVYIHEDTGAECKLEEDNVNLRNDIVAGKIYKSRVFQMNSADVDQLVVKEYPLLCLNNSTDINFWTSKAIYAQRIDRPAGMIDGNAARKYHNQIGQGAFYSYLPTPEDLALLAQIETGIFQPEYGTPYWTTEGAYYWNGTSVEKATSVSHAYVRCVYKSYNYANEIKY